MQLARLLISATFGVLGLADAAFASGTVQATYRSLFVVTGEQEANIGTCSSCHTTTPHAGTPASLFTNNIILRDYYSNNVDEFKATDLNQSQHSERFETFSNVTSHAARISPITLDKSNPTPSVQLDFGETGHKFELDVSGNSIKDDLIVSLTSAGGAPVTPSGESRTAGLNVGSLANKFGTYTLVYSVKSKSNGFCVLTGGVCAQSVQLTLQNDGVLAKTRFDPGETQLPLLDTDGDTIAYIPDTITPSGGGTVQVAADGSFTYTPPAAGPAGDVSFKVRFNETLNPNPVTFEQTVTLTVNPNIGPIARDDTFTVDQGETRTFNVVKNPSGRDEDPDDDTPLKVRKLTDPAFGTATLAENGRLTFTASATSSADVSFRYEVEDSGGAAARARVNIIVNRVNQNPDVQDLTATVTAGRQAYRSNLSRLTDDPEGDELSFRIVADSLRFMRNGREVAGGSVSLSQDGALAAQWPVRWYGTIEFGFRAADHKDGAAPVWRSASEGKVTITVPEDERLQTDHVNDYGRLLFLDKETPCYVVSPYFDKAVRGRYRPSGSRGAFKEIDSLGIFLSQGADGAGGHDGIPFDPYNPKPFKPGSSMEVNCDGEGFTVPLTSAKTPRELKLANAFMKNVVPGFNWIDVYFGDELKIRTVPPGTTVWLSTELENENNDPVTFEWRVTGGTLSSSSAREPRWTLPRARGLFKVYAMISDGRGGYLQVGRTISTDGQDPLEDTVVWPGERGLSTAVPAEDHFLSFHFKKNRTTERLPDDDITSCAYYKAIGIVNGCTADGDMIGVTTFGTWKRDWGFDPKGRDAVKALYRNDEDLELQRDMHAVRRGDELAYYVCNYSPDRVDTFRNIVVKDDELLNARTGDRFVACVAMEYSRSPSSDQPYTKFIIFGPDGLPLKSIDLDGRGEKFVPGACVACHGAGSAYTRFDGEQAKSGDLGSRFLPFDLDNYTFSTKPGLRRTDQQKDFKVLNEWILKTNAAPATRELIRKWYAGGTVFNGRAVPDGWKTERELYLNVIAPSCRGCHLAMKDGMNLATADELKARAVLVKGYVCGYRVVPDHLAYSMPNAARTFSRFWGTKTGVYKPDFVTKFLVKVGALKPGDECRPPRER